MKKVTVILILLVLVVGGCFQSVSKRVCLPASVFETSNGPATVFKSDEAILVAYKLSVPPDVSSLVTVEDQKFIDIFSALDADSVITNIDQMRKESGYTLSQLTDSPDRYAKEHMKVYVKTKDDTWYSIQIPDFC